MLRDACDLFPPWWQSCRTLTGSNPITARPVQSVKHQISFPTDAFQVAPWTQNSHLPELHSFPGAPRSSCRWSKMLEQIICTAVSDTHSFHSDQCKAARPVQFCYGHFLQARTSFKPAPTTVFHGAHTCVVRDAGADNLHSSGCQSNHTARPVQCSFLLDAFASPSSYSCHSVGQ